MLAREVVRGLGNDFEIGDHTDYEYYNEKTMRVRLDCGK